MAGRKIGVPCVEYTSSAPTQLSTEVMDIANDLSFIHGTVRIAKESSGLHLYIASPAALEEYGAAELEKFHCSINVTKYLDQDDDNCAYCHKTDTPYRMSELLGCPPLAQRGFSLKPRVIGKDVQMDEKFMDRDHLGRLWPKSPGKVIPLNELSAGNPAIDYVKSRGYNPVALWKQFRCGFCVEDRPEISYRRLKGGFRASPKGRLIFFIDCEGACMGWQSRILECKNDTQHFYYNGDDEEWVAVADLKDGVWVVKDMFRGVDGKFDCCRYQIALGTKKNQAIMGLDSARAANKFDSQGRKYTFVCEGPMDVSRLGMPACAILGKSISDTQANLLAKYFTRIIYVQDSDAAGISAAKRIQRVFTELHPVIKLNVIAVPDGFKDVGEMSQSAVEEMKQKVL